MSKESTPPTPLSSPRKIKHTVASLLKLKGKRKLVLTTAFDEWTARAAEQAGVDMVVSWGSCFEHSKFVIDSVRRGAPNTMIGSGINPGAYESTEKAINLANQLRTVGTDIIYCSGLVPDKFAALSRQHFPCCGHVGYLPCNDTWFGGPRAVGKTAAEAQKVFDDVMALEQAGCIAVEMECVPARLAAEITKRTKMLVFSMGSGSGCDGQFIFSEDILGTGVGRYPRHAYRKLNVMEESIQALAQFKDDVISGSYPAENHCIKMKDEVFQSFMEKLD